MGLLFLELGASGLAPWELWLMGHEPLSLRSGQPGGPFGRVGGGSCSGCR